MGATTAHAPCMHTGAYVCTHTHTHMLITLDDFTKPKPRHFYNAPESSSLRMRSRALPSPKSDL